MSESDFTERLARAQDDAIDSRELASAVRARVLSGAAPRVDRTDRSWRFAGIASLGMAAAAATALLMLPAGPRELSAQQGGQPLRVGAWIDASAADATIDFSDGTVVRLERGSSARLGAMTANGAHLVLERGTVDLDVVHTGDANWQVQAGPFSVAVTGTAFETRWQPESDAFTLQMREGSVFVTGPGLGQGQRVSGTDGLNFDLGERRGEITLNRAPEPASPVEARPAPVRAPAPAGTAEADPSWWDAVLAHDYDAALTRARAEGLAEVLGSSDAEHLLGLADAAGQIGDHGVQAQAHGAVRAQFPGTEGAATAALMMGRVALDRRKDAHAAASWFRTAHDESKVRGTQVMALGLYLAALDQSGESKAAKQAAIEYLEKYPEGPHAGLAGRLAPHKR